MQKLAASDPVDDARYGQAVALSGPLLVSGAFKHDASGASAGAVYVHRFDGDDWGTSGTRLLASDGAAGDRFGWAVSAHGDRILVGARADDDQGFDSGSAYVFRWTGSAWVEEAKLLPAGGGADDEFGTSVALLADFAFVGAPHEDTAGSDAGAVYVFERSGTSWNQVDVLRAMDATGGDVFGTAVAADGSALVVGAPLETQGGTASGAAYVFEEAAGTWSQAQKLTSTDLSSNDRFGGAVDVSGDSLIVGAFNADGATAAAGAAYVFRDNGAVWAQEQKLTASDGGVVDFFGYAVALSGEGAVVGAYLEDEAGSDAGAAYCFARDGAAWSESVKLVGADSAAGDAFGFAVDLDGVHVAVGAWGDDDGEDEAGAAYGFSWSPSLGSPYCPGLANSVGAGVPLAARGSRIVADDGLELEAWCGPPEQPGVFFTGDAAVDVPFGNGRRCVGGTLVRLNPPQAFSAAGSVSRSVDFGAPPLAGNLLPGTTWYFQLWYRDPAAGGAFFNLSGAVALDLL